MLGWEIFFYVNEITITNYKRDQFSPKNSSYFSKSQEMIKILIFIVIAGIHDEKRREKVQVVRVFVQEMTILWNKI